MNCGREPDLGFAIRVGNMNMDARLFPREEEQAKGAIANDCGCHRFTVSEALSQGHPPKRARAEGEVWLT